MNIGQVDNNNNVNDNIYNKENAPALSKSVTSEVNGYLIRQDESSA